MRAGDLKDYVAFKSVAEAEDGLGGITTTWSTTFSDWVAIWQLSATENVKNMAVNAEMTHRVRMRYRSGVTHKMVIYRDGEHFPRALEIKSIINTEERNRTLDLICNELDVSLLLLEGGGFLLTEGGDRIILE